MPVHCNVNIIGKENKNKKRNYKKPKREQKSMVRVEWFRQELSAFLCLCRALKIIIMYIISLGSILKPSQHHIGRKKKLIYFNMHHTSLAHSLPCDMEKKRTNKFVWCIYSKKQREEEMSWTCKKKRLKSELLDNALWHRWSKSGQLQFEALHAHNQCSESAQNKLRLVFVLSLHYFARCCSHQTCALMYATSKSASIFMVLGIRKTTSKSKSRWSRKTKKQTVEDFFFDPFNLQF